MEDNFFDVPKSGQEQQDRSIPEFHIHPVFVGKNKETGVDQYEDRDYVKILNPGQRDMVDREVTPEDTQRWPGAWMAYKEGKEAPLNGYPLEKCGAFGPADVKMLNSFHLRTVEDVAQAPDTALQRIGRGAVELKKNAQRWIREHESHDSLIARIESLESGVGVPNAHIPAPDGDDLTVAKLELKEERKKNGKLREKYKRVKDERDQLQARLDALNADKVPQTEVA